MLIQSNITQTNDGQITVKGKNVIERANTQYFSEVLCEVALGIDPKYAYIVDEMLILFIDHGLEAPSTMATRMAASCDVSLPNAIISAVACFGARHLPVADAAQFLLNAVANNLTPEEACKTVKRVAGIGHPIHVTGDPRVAHLFNSFGIDKGKYCEYIQSVSVYLNKPINYAGACAAIMLDCGAKNPEAMACIAIISRICGLTAHYTEQKIDNKLILYGKETILPRKER